MSAFGLAVPPLPQAVFRRVVNSAKSFWSARSQVTTVTTRPHLRLAVVIFARCRDGGIIAAKRARFCFSDSVHRHCCTSSSQWSQRGGMSNAVPANSRVMV